MIRSLHAGACRISFDSGQQTLSLYPAPYLGMTPAIPAYLEQMYWWAYVRPWAVRLFDRQWMVELILLGNYGRLRNETLKEFGTDLSGRTLQVGSCYGDLTPCVADKVAVSGGTYDVIDILPVQLENLQHKIRPDAPVGTFLMDAAALQIPDASYDRVLVFLLLHEQPQEYRKRTLKEALRVLKPGGKLVIMDYGRPAWWHPVRYSTLLVYAWLKPYAVDVWNGELTELLAHEMSGREWSKTTYFGGLFQKLVSSG